MEESTCLNCWQLVPFPSEQQPQRWLLAPLLNPSFSSFCQIFSGLFGFLP